MSEPTPREQNYKVSVHEREDESDALIFEFVSKSPPHEPDQACVPTPAQQFIVSVSEKAQVSGELEYDWGSSPNDPGDIRYEIQDEIAARMKDRAVWIERVTVLVSQIEEWAKEMGWSTRRIEKKLEDTRIGRHRIPALLMQEETCRVLLEPIGRRTPGTEGLVDLYLMPAYDDIASLFFYDNRWQLHYMFPGTESVGDVRETESLPLSKESLEKVLSEMRQNAA